MSKYLYHFTNIYHVREIMKSGYLKLTPSNLIEPKDLKLVKIGKGHSTWVSAMSDPVKPVVWLTDSSNSSRMGLDGGKPDKTRIKITIPMKEEYKWWLTWAQKNRMSKSWFKRFTNGYNYGSWYISESPIYLTDILRIEDLETGEVFYENPKAEPAA